MGRAGASIAVVADDEPAIRELLEGLLGHELGFRVVAVPDGEQALRAIAAERPDVVLLDHRMPGLDGFEVARRLRAAEATRGVPILCISAHADEAEALEAGCTRFLGKPFDLDDVVLAVQEALRASGGAAAGPPMPN
jgi:CheY-like chemotaxis protein